MQILKFSVVALTIASSFDIVTAQRSDLPETAKNQTVNRSVMFEILDKIDQAPSLSPMKAGEILGVKLDPVPQESDDFTYIFRGHGGLWKEAELRLPPQGDGSKFVLVLRPAARISIQQIADHFGKDFTLNSPNPNARDKATYGYSYLRKMGRLRFSFPSFQDPFAVTVLFDRA